MAFRRSLSESRLSDFGRKGLSLPLVKRVEDLGLLRRAISTQNLTPADKYSRREKIFEPVKQGYSRPSWFWTYNRDIGWKDIHAKDRQVLGSRFWPSYSQFRRRYDPRPSYVYPSWDPRYGARDFSDRPADYWARNRRDNSYYNSYKSWNHSSFTNDDFLTPKFTYSLKMPFFYYNYYKPRTPYMYFF